MKKILFIIIYYLIMGSLNAYASSVLFPYQGGTGTSTAPIFGQVLVGQSNGTYAPQATSSLGISTGGSGTNYLTSSGSNTYLNTGTNLQAPTFNSTSTTGTSTFANAATFGGFVGIGTISPTTELYLSTVGASFEDAITMDADANQKDTIYFLKAGSPKWAIYSPISSNDLRVWDGSDRVTFQSGGNVGINQTNPSQKLEVDGKSLFKQTTSGGNVIGISDASGVGWNISLGTEAIPNIYIGGSVVGSQYFWRANWNTAGVAVNTFRSASGATTLPTVNVLGVTGQTADFLDVNATGTTMGSTFAVQAGGNVGIGTTSPSNLLEVAGNSFFSGNVTATGTATINGHLGLGTAPTGDLFAMSGGGNNTSSHIYSGGSGNFAYTTWGRTGDEVEFGVSAGAGQFFNGTVAGTAVLKQVNTSGNLMLGIGGGNPSMTFVNGGNVGIGSTTPSQVLTVTGSGQFSSGLGLGGAVPNAIVTSQPMTLNVTGYSNLNGFRVNGADAVNSIYQVNSTNMGLTANSGNAINFNCFSASTGCNGGGASTMMSVNTSGSVGISTTSSAANLAVASILTNSSTTPIFTIASSTSMNYSIDGNGGFITMGVVPTATTTVLGAGATSTVQSIVGMQMGGQITMKTGSGYSTSNAPIVKITYPSPCPTGNSNPIVFPANGAAAQIPSSNYIYVSTTTTGFSINNGGIGPSTSFSTVYSWDYSVTACW